MTRAPDKPSEIARRRRRRKRRRRMGMKKAYTKTTTSGKMPKAEITREG